MYDASKLFHIGIRVPDIDQAMTEIGDAMEVTWASVQDREMSVWQPGVGQRAVRLALTYSVEGPVHLELLQGPPGSIWDGNDAPGAHHFGVWSDDVAGETRRSLDAGWTLELAAAAPEDGFGRFTYVRSPTGFLVERSRSPTGRASSVGGPAVRSPIPSPDDRARRPVTVAGRIGVSATTLCGREPDEAALAGTQLARSSADRRVRRRPRRRGRRTRRRGHQGTRVGRRR